jgi:hypothetical protein
VDCREVSTRITAGEPMARKTAITGNSTTNRRTCFVRRWASDATSNCSESVTSAPVTKASTRNGAAKGDAAVMPAHTPASATSSTMVRNSEAPATSSAAKSARGLTG